MKALIAGIILVSLASVATAQCEAIEGELTQLGDRPNVMRRIEGNPGGALSIVTGIIGSVQD